MRTIKTNQLMPETTVLIDGTVEYSHIASWTEGEELNRYNQRQQQYGRGLEKYPFAQMVIENASVRMANPNAPTIAEQYFCESLYQKNDKTGGMHYRATKKNARGFASLPDVMVIENNNAIKITPVGELAKGLKVTLVMRVFKSQPNNGITLDAVLVNEPIRYYTNNVGNVLQRYGLNIIDKTEPNAPVQPHDNYPEVEPQIPYQQPVVTNPYNANNANQGMVIHRAPQTAPTQPFTPGVQVQPTNPQVNTYDDYENPYAPDMQNNQPTIVFNPNGKRNY